MKFVSWNVNGLRAVLQKGLLDFIGQADADVVCLQETRALPEQVDFNPPGYTVHWNPAERKGYSGTAVLTRVAPLGVTRGLGQPALDTEGRVLTLEFTEFYLVNVYTPNVGRTLERLEYRSRTWDPAFLKYLKKLRKSKPVVFCGDLNVAHQEVDLADPAGNAGNAGFTDQERAGFDRIIQAGFIDTFRAFTPEGGHYTWWAYYGRARQKNLGWRIDYFGISPELRPRLASADILADVMGSDHCPITMTLT